MSEKIRSIKTKDVTDEEARDYLLQISALLNEINRLEEEKDDFNKDINKQIKAEQKKLEALRAILNDGIIITVHNFMDKNTKEIIWKDENGNEIERTPFDDKDWEIFNKQAQGTLFKDDEQMATTGEYPTRPELGPGEIIDAESEDIPTDGLPENSSYEDSPFDEHGEKEVKAEGDGR